MLITKNMTALVAAVSVVAGLTSLRLKAQSPVPTPIGAWFGIARPCTSGVTRSKSLPEAGFSGLTLRSAHSVR